MQCWRSKETDFESKFLYFFLRIMSENVLSHTIEDTFCKNHFLICKFRVHELHMKKAIWPFSWVRQWLLPIWNGWALENGCKVPFLLLHTYVQLFIARLWMTELHFMTFCGKLYVYCMYVCRIFQLLRLLTHLLFFTELKIKFILFPKT